MPIYGNLGPYSKFEKSEMFCSGFAFLSAPACLSIIGSIIVLHKICISSQDVCLLFSVQNSQIHYFVKSKVGLL